MGRSRYQFTQPDQPHFMTLTILHWIPVFTRPQTVVLLLDSLRYLAGQGLSLYAYVILENHIHFLAQSPQLDKDIARFKSHTAKQLIGYLTEKNVGRYWISWLSTKKPINHTGRINFGKKVCIRN